MWFAVLAKHFCVFPHCLNLKFRQNRLEINVCACRTNYTDVDVKENVQNLGQWSVKAGGFVKSIYS